MKKVKNNVIRIVRLTDVKEFNNWFFITLLSKLEKQSTTGEWKPLDKDLIDMIKFIGDQLNEGLDKKFTEK